MLKEAFGSPKTLIPPHKQPQAVVRVPLSTCNCPPFFTKSSAPPTNIILAVIVNEAPLCMHTSLLITVSVFQLSDDEVIFIVSSVLLQSL